MEISKVSSSFTGERPVQVTPEAAWPFQTTPNHNCPVDRGNQSVGLRMGKGSPSASLVRLRLLRSFIARLPSDPAAEPSGALDRNRSPNVVS